MTDLLLYWRDYRRNQTDGGKGVTSRRWHSSSRLMSSLQPDDRLWLAAAAGKLGLVPPSAGHLVEVWRVRAVLPNSGDSPAYPPERYAWRILAQVDARYTPPMPLNVDAVIRPRGSDAAAPIGRLLQGPRRLSAEQVQQLTALLEVTPPSEGDAPFPISDVDPDRIALGIRQPWAELILQGIKTVEVRTLETNVRGPIYLYTSRIVADTPAARRAISVHRLTVEDLPRGRLVGTVELLDCRPCTPADARSACLPAEALAGRFAWLLGKPQRLDLPLRPPFLPYGVWFYPFRRRRTSCS